MMCSNRHDKLRRAFRLVAVCLLSIIGCIPAVLHAQTKLIEPILLDKEILSGLHLEPVTASWAPPERQIFSRTVYSGKYFDVTVMAGSTGKGVFRNYEIDEFVYVINGQATLTTDDGVSQTFRTGDFFMVPKGFSGEWHSQGNLYYQELIVVMKERSDVAINGSTRPFLIDKTRLSGLGIPKITWPLDPDREVYREVLYDGTELDVAIVAGATATTKLSEPLSEEFVYVVNGTATLTAPGGQPHKFYTGDFFVVPDGFIGTWTSTGNHLYRELIAIPGAGH
jgi:uncharacterized cupin superfamily protein